MRALQTFKGFEGTQNFTFRMEGFVRAELDLAKKTWVREIHPVNVEKIKPFFSLTQSHKGDDSFDASSLDYKFYFGSYNTQKGNNDCDSHIDEKMLLLRRRFEGVD